ncbi:hypothetical protein LSCM1_01488 [Leishmania martiniquensis]|uniref:Uncharacterized protein n=1 Tax=Leishmania martiniquensis TaxID=1580590 RepID=A0A836H7B1_9TRYP|nr:hypothetical protein LSCM1_01488 [Leishmania martiniquensis]
MPQYMVLFPCGFGLVSIVVGIAFCCCLSRKMDRNDEGDGSAEGREGVDAAAFGNRLPRIDGHTASPYELHDRRHGGEQPVVAVVADRQPCIGIVVPAYQGGAPSTSLDAIDYGEAVYVSVSDIYPTSKAPQHLEAAP